MTAPERGMHLDPGRVPTTLEAPAPQAEPVVLGQDCSRCSEPNDPAATITLILPDGEIEQVCSTACARVVLDDLDGTP